VKYEDCVKFNRRCQEMKNSEGRMQK
jgi:hypothetical protein